MALSYLRQRKESVAKLIAADSSNSLFLVILIVYLLVQGDVAKI